MASTVPGFNLLHLDSSTRPAELNVRSLDALVAGNGIQSCLALSWRVTWRQRFGDIKQVTLLRRPSYCNLIKEPNKIDIPKYLILAIGNCTQHTWIFFYFVFNDPPQPAPQIKWQFLYPPQPDPRVTRGVRGLWDDPRITSLYFVTSDVKQSLRFKILTILLQYSNNKCRFGAFNVEWQIVVALQFKKSGSTKHTLTDHLLRFK